MKLKSGLTGKDRKDFRKNKCGVDFELYAKVEKLLNSFVEAVTMFENKESLVIN